MKLNRTQKLLTWFWFSRCLQQRFPSICTKQLLHPNAGCSCISLFHVEVDKSANFCTAEKLFSPILPRLCILISNTEIWTQIWKILRFPCLNTRHYAHLWTFQTLTQKSILVSFTRIGCIIIGENKRRLDSFQAHCGHNSTQKNTITPAANWTLVLSLQSIT
jgi:hypothetical protein